MLRALDGNYAVCPIRHGGHISHSDNYMLPIEKCASPHAAARDIRKFLYRLVQIPALT